MVYAVIELARAVIKFKSDLGQWKVTKYAV